MLCPKCGTATLRETLGPSGVLVDHCSTCNGLWLDRGEVFHYLREPSAFQALMKEALKRTAPSTRACPRCRKNLVQVRFKDASLVIDGCEVCAGLWLDKGEIQAISSMLARPLAPAHSAAVMHSSPDSPMSPAGFQAPPPMSASALAALAPAALPNLAFRSGGVLIGLYSVLAVFLYFAALLHGIQSELALLVAVVGLALNFLISPLMLDLSLKWVHTFEWVQPDALPSGTRAFLVELCAKQGIPLPRLGLIKDGNPNAFTYGHTPQNARLVVSTGLIERLDEDELNGVLGHEVGHIVHWDMLVMTVAAVVPILLYQLYRSLMRSGKSSSGKKGGGAHIALVAYILYVVTDYLVRFLSRVRELHADRFGAQATGKPNALATALVKIAYGLSSPAAAKEEADKEAVAAGGGTFAQSMGIFDPVAAKALVASSVTTDGFSPSAIKGAMQWDLWNPWAKWYELHSTHPLPARRIEHLGRQAASMGQAPTILFDLEQPESFWDEFFMDLVAQQAPLLLAGVGAVAWAASNAGVGQGLGLVVGGWGLGFLLNTWFSYQGDLSNESSVSALLKVVKVSRIRGVPATLQGKVIGRGDAGFVFSEDLMLQDPTGMILLDYAQPLAIIQLWFALAKVPGLQGKLVTVTGWYRRGPVPYFELRTIRGGSVDSTSRTYEFCLFLGGAAVAAAFFLAF